MNPEETNKKANQEYEELVAYLDGELDQEKCAVVEQRLASDSQYLSQLRHLQQTWDLLDTLPRPHVTETFTKSTLEMVVLKESRAIRKQKNHWWTWPSRLVTAAVIGGFAAFLGYALLHSIQDAPNRQLIRDLGVIENVDIYRSVDSVEFLTDLDKAGLFVQDDPGEP